jgi:glycosyltransferase involved in cell wall biosynthesis
MTNLYLTRGTGTEAVTELLADGLRRAGHEPIIFAPETGPQADRMRERGHRVLDRLAGVGAPPDVIHAQHTTPALMAMAAFPGVPTVFASHSTIFEVEAPWPHPQIRRFTALSERGRDRCVERGIAAEQVALIPNAVDLQRFRARPPLPAKPRRALLVAKTYGHAEAIRAACASHGLALDEVGFATGRVSSKLEEEFRNHDLVFASGRSALEAAAVGCAVVLVDGAGLAGMLTMARADSWRSRNYSAALLIHPASTQAIGEAIAAYDAEDAARVSAHIRSEASADIYTARHLALYADAMADAPTASQTELAMATAVWLEELLPSPAQRAWRTVAKELGSPEHAGNDRELLTTLMATVNHLPSQRVMRGLRLLARRFLPVPMRQWMHHRRQQLSRPRMGHG